MYPWLTVVIVKTEKTLYWFLSLESILLFKKERTKTQKIHIFYTTAICTGYKRKKDHQRLKMLWIIRRHEGWAYRTFTLLN